jgi:hypothetical protein
VETVALDLTESTTGVAVSKLACPPVAGTGVENLPNGCGGTESYRNAPAGSAWRGIVGLVGGLCVVCLPSSVNVSVRRTAGPGLEAQCPAPDFSACGLGTLPRLQMAAGMPYALVWKRFFFL